MTSASKEQVGNTTRRFLTAFEAAAPGTMQTAIAEDATTFTQVAKWSTRQ